MSGLSPVVQALGIFVVLHSCINKCNETFELLHFACEHVIVMYVFIDLCFLLLFALDLISMGQEKISLRMILTKPSWWLGGGLHHWNWNTGTTTRC